MNIKCIFNSIFDGVFSYSSARSAKIDSLAVAVLFRLAQILIIGYVIGWELVYKKGYQINDPVSSTVTTKVKGFGYENESDYTVVYDTPDYIVPPNEYNSIFVMTSFLSTEQSQGICEEDYTKLVAQCVDDSDCKNVNFNTWSGIPTGKCINSTRNSTINVCEVRAWCPTEDPRAENVNIQNVLNYTIFIKNDVEFKLLKKKERNILANITNKYLSSCAYHPKFDPYCPVFRIQTLMEGAESDPKEREIMLKKGAVIQIVITWNCNYDITYWRRCQPKYSFERFDLPFKQSETASGFNFRFANKFLVNQTEYRNLIKAYGLRFIILVEGKAGKFNVLPLFLTIGAGLGLLSLATVIANFYMLNLSKNRKVYKKITYLDMDENNDGDDETIDDNVKIWYDSQLSIGQSRSLVNINYNSN